MQGKGEYLSNSKMHGVYQFKIENYGLYISQSFEPSNAIVKQLDILSNGTHHCLPLQRLWKFFPDLFSYQIVSTVPEPLVNIAMYSYSKNFPFTINSAYGSKLVKNNNISRRYSSKHKILCIEVDEYGFAHIHDENLNKIGLEVAASNLVSGFYKTTHSGKGPIKRIIRDGIPPGI